MKVRELIAHLHDQEQEDDVMVLLSNPQRAYSGPLNSIKDINVTINQNTNKSISILRIEK